MARKKMSRVLLVEDSASLEMLYTEYLKSEPIDLTCIDNGVSALEFINANIPEVVLLDINLPDISGFDILKHINKNAMPIEVVVITSHGSVDIAVEAMRHGAFDFMVKPVNADRLRVTLHNALEHRNLSNIVSSFKDNFERDSFQGIIGSSLPMQGVYRIIENAAVSKASVFITGESGTGKELCARAIHNLSNRADKKLVTLNCAAIPGDLMESEIFGHIKGAFTGAHANREGAASLAHEGTLFLDELCEMDLDLQSKLLRFTQTGQFQKVGDVKEKQVDVRFISATNRDPLEEVKAGRFREDLYYRLHVIPVHLPPLRERQEDILTIAKRFLVEYAKEENKHFKDFSFDAANLIQNYSWPGNIRQLQNVIRNAIVLNQGEQLSADHLPVEIRKETTDASATYDVAKTAPSISQKINNSEHFDTANQTNIRPLSVVEREVIEQAIAHCGGNIPIAAAMLQVSPSTIYRKKQSWQNES